MKKDAYYFPHFSNADSDPKIKRLKRVHGWAGKGLYFTFLEILREQTNFRYPLAGVEDLAYEWHVAKEILFSIINDFDLFLIEENEFFSPKLILYLQPYLEKSKRAQNAAATRWSNANAMQMHSKSNANVLPEQCMGNASKVKESKVKESKVKETKVKDMSSAKHLFCHSPYFVFDSFKNTIGEKFQKYDLDFYHQIAVNYSESKGIMYRNWLAAIRNWILRDIADNKPRVMPPASKDEKDIKAERDKKLAEAMKKLNNQTA